MAEFIGWDLPEVMKYDGSLVTLYMECILPLLYVEQRHGWSAIQATTPRYFQIRDIEKKAIEFLLNLDACKADVLRKRIEQEEARIKHDWRLLREECNVLAGSIGGAMRNIPAEPTANWPAEVLPVVEVYDNNQPISLEKSMERIVSSLRVLENEQIPAVNQIVNETESQLHSTYSELRRLQLAHDELVQRTVADESEERALEVRLKALNEDLKKNQDVERLRNFGGVIELDLLEGKCPTCHQGVTDSLLPQERDHVVMTIPENIEYIRTQIQTFERMRRRLVENLRAKERRRDALETMSNELRGSIRALKQTLVTDGRTPSLAAVRQRIQLEEKTQQLTYVQEKINAKLGGFRELASDWREHLVIKQTISNEVFSSSDKEKLDVLEKRVVELENQFGFNSFPTDKLSLSRKTYKPVREGFDVVYDVSASDNIRTICSYLIGLLEIARIRATNHPGLLILDEPRQQNLDWRNFTAVLLRAANSLKAGQQVIVATSDSAPDVGEIQELTGCHTISFEGQIFKKISD